MSSIDLNKIEIPEFQTNELNPKKSKYCVCIPVINEGEKIIKQLARMEKADLFSNYDVVLVDGGSTDGSLNLSVLEKLGLRAVIIKNGPGKLSAQLRLGYYFCLINKYEGVITIDGNNKDSVEAIPSFAKKLDQGFDFVQGSRFIDGGKAINTPWIRHIAVKLIHVPLISILARFRFTDTTNGFRAYSARVINDVRFNIFRNIFDTYELLAYLSVQVPRLGFKTIEVPVERHYPAKGKTPTKISFFKGNFTLLLILLKLVFRRYKLEKYYG